MNLLQKMTWGILALCFISCSDKKPKESDSSDTAHSWHEASKTAEDQLLTSEAVKTEAIGTNNITAIFDASLTNTTLIGDNRGSLGSLGGFPGNLILKNPSHSFSTSGFTSTDDINTLKGSNLAPTDIVTVTIRVSSLSGARIRHDGIHFGLGDKATFGVEDAGDLQVRMKARNAKGTILTFFNGSDPIDTGHIAKTEELMNGFTARLVADVKGYTFTLESVAHHPNPKIISGTFTGTQFVDIIGSGHFYYTAQQFKNNENLVSSISQARIEIFSAP